MFDKIISKLNQMKELIYKITKLGFKPKTRFTGKVIHYSKTNIKPSEAYSYLFLCEIQKWLRDEQNLLVCIYSNASSYLWTIMDDKGGTDRGWSDTSGPNESGVWDNYEEALLAGIKESINLIKQ